MFRLLLRLCLVCACCLTAACGGAAGQGSFHLDLVPEAPLPPVLAAGEPIPSPVLPPDLVALAAQEQRPPAPEKKAPALAYSLIIKAPGAPDVAAAFRAASLLERLVATPVATVTGLEQRLRPDLETARDVLHAYGYYAGSVRGTIHPAGEELEGGSEKTPEEAPGEAPEKNEKVKTAPALPADAGHIPSIGRYVVTITMNPGPCYTVGETRVRMKEPFRAPPGVGNEPAGIDSAPSVPSGASPPALPVTLADVGLTPGSPAQADAVLDAVAAVREAFRDRGYPHATIAGTRYTLNTTTRTLDVDVRVDSGPFARMGGLAIMGQSPVSRAYLEALVPWRPGRAWDQSRVEAFRSALRQSGLFAAAEITPGPADGTDGLRPVDLTLTPAPERTVGGALKYDSDFGPGIQAYWEHRNLTGRGDRLRLEAPVWSDLQEMAATYRLPFFFRRDQDFTASAAFRHETTRAYELTSAAGATGLERRISRRWRAGLSAAGEWGDLKDPDTTRHTYYMTGLPGKLAYDGTDSLLDAVRGARATLNLAPYTGSYTGDFSVVRGRFEAQAFAPLLGEDTLVLALRGMYGALTGAEAEAVPSSLRYYVGGGGSVRGYEYQSLGPRNASRDPLGGSSAVELSAEARLRFTETWGAVAFLDGGMAYAERTPASDPLRWGAGVGLRLYTAIGPVRLDLATPLNPRRKDSGLQVYFSIGQSF